MQKTDCILNEKLLQLGNPRFWGKVFQIRLKEGAIQIGKLIRVNWTMKFGIVTGYLLISSDNTEKRIELENVLDISQDTLPEKSKPVILANTEFKPEVKIIGSRRKTGSFEVVG